FVRHGLPQHRRGNEAAESRLGIVSALAAAPPASAGGTYTAVAKGVGRMPIWLVHGDADKTVSVEESRHMFAELQAEGDEVHLTELPGATPLRCVFAQPRSQPA